MRLFITNKNYFEEQFDAPERFENSIREPLTSSQIHKDAYRQLANQVTIEHSIPMCILSPYDNGEGVAVFDFVTKKGEIYYYQFTTTAS